MVTCAESQAHAVKFSEQQVHVIIRMRTLYLHNLGALVRRRQTMAAVLQVRIRAVSCQSREPIAGSLSDRTR